MFYFDPNYMIVFLITMLVSAGAQMMIRSAYSKWSQVRNSAGLTGTAVARRIIQSSGLGSGVYGSGQAAGQGIQLAHVPGQLTDHYDPRSHTVRMSDAVANRDSVVAMAVAAHELGHAQQHEQHSPLILMRNFLVPAVQVSPKIAFGLIMIGLFFNIIGALQLGIIFFGVMVVFAVLTIPVEVDASLRGLRLLDEAGLMISPSDRSGSQAVLRAAAMTYIAAAVTAILQLLYYLSLANRRR